MLPPSRSPEADSAEHVGRSARCALHEDRQAHATCGRCGRLACVACTHVLASGRVRCASCHAEAAARPPAAAPSSEEAPDGPIFFERRKELGLVRAVTATIAGVFIAPGSTFARGTQEKALWPTLLFGLIAFVIGRAGTVTWNLVFFEQDRAAMASTALGKLLAPLVTREMFLAELAVSPLVFALGLLGSSVAWWLGLRVVRVRAPIDVTIRALCFAQALAVLLPVVALLGRLGPIGGLLTLAYWAWTFAVPIVAMARFHRISVGRTLLAYSVSSLVTLTVLCLVSMPALWWMATQIELPRGL